jgi:hypothetical protein
MPTFALAAPISPPAPVVLSRPISGSQIDIALNRAGTVVGIGAGLVSIIQGTVTTYQAITKWIDNNHRPVLITSFDGKLQPYIIPNSNISITTNTIDPLHYNINLNRTTTSKGNPYVSLVIGTRLFLDKASGTWNYSDNHNDSLQITATGGCVMHSYGVSFNCTIRSIKSDQGELAIITVSGGRFDGTYVAGITGTRSSPNLFLKYMKTNKYYYFSPN